MLKVVEHIKSFGLDETVKKFSLIQKGYPHKILLKYDQLGNSELFSNEEVKESRGLILERETWKPMSFAFKKFFNAQEANADKIDWNTAEVLFKNDGTMIQLYWDWVTSEWTVGTTGTANGEGMANNGFISFSDLFKRTVLSYNSDFFNRLETHNCYVFELMTPDNVVVTPHQDYALSLLTVRDMTSLCEYKRGDVVSISERIGVPIVGMYSFTTKNIGQLLKTFENMPWTEEGYVVVDTNFKRVKVKNPAYVAAHHAVTGNSPYSILSVIKTNEVDEYLAVFQKKAKETNALKDAYDALIDRLSDLWVTLSEQKPKNITPNERKRYAEAVFKNCKQRGLDGYAHIFFSLVADDTKTIKGLVDEIDNKTLYKKLIETK